MRDLTLAKSIVSEVIGESAMEVGKRVQHPDGYMVEITSGQYWGEHGLSNFWHWRRVMPDGSLSQNEENGYGWHK